MPDRPHAKQNPVGRSSSGYPDPNGLADMISKLFWLIVIAIAVVVLVPPVREKVWPKLSPAFNPLYEWSARNRVDEISMEVKRADATGRTVPGGDKFPAFIDSDAMQQDASIDPWGNPYYIVFGNNSFQIGSNGKDGQPGTEDDIISAAAPINHVPDGRRF